MNKILLNCSTLMKGGALQVALSVFAEAIKDNEIMWFFAVTPTLLSKFEELLGDSLGKERIFLLDKSPARSISARQQLKNIVKQQQFNAVFTLFGPAYVTFPVPHLCGIADGWVTHSNKTAYQLLNTVREKIYTYLLCNYKLWWYKKADKWCVEAQVAKDGFLAKTDARTDAVVVIANAVNPVIQNYAATKIERSLDETINVFCLGADYWHKNYQIVPDVLLQLKQKINKKINFIFTLPEKSPVYLHLINKARKMQVDQDILNLGPLTLPEVVNAYQKYDILFFPSVLETFSITPLEALYMNMPMIISNIPANEQVIGEYANYVAPLDSAGIAEKFIKAIVNYDQDVIKLQELKEQSYFDNLFTATERFNTYKSILKIMTA